MCVCVCVCVWRICIHKMTASTSLSYALRNWLLRGWVSRACTFLPGSAIKGRPLCWLLPLSTEELPR